MPIIVFCNLKNLGDLLNIYILNKIGLNVTLSDKLLLKPYFLFIGSLVQPAYCNKFAVICGAGYYVSNLKVNLNTIYYVRGVYTRNLLIKQGYHCPELYGDPALILPKIYNNPNININKQFSFIPHISDIHNYVNHNINNTIFFNIDVHNIESTLDNIISSKYIISSSLHGIILGHAYNKKVLWINLFDGSYLHNDPIKFLDYYSSLNIFNITPYNIKEFLLLNDHQKIILIENYPNPSMDTINYITNNIINLTPFININK